jgi:hypothetical protein
MAAEWVRGMVAPQRLGDATLIESIVTMFERKSADTFERQIRALLQRPDASPSAGRRDCGCRPHGADGATNGGRPGHGDLADHPLMP